MLKYGSTQPSTQSLGVTVAINPDVLAKYKDLLTDLQNLGSAVVAYSGGVDSTFLAYAAYQALQSQVIAVTAESPSYSDTDRCDALRFAKQIGIRHIFVQTSEIENEAYAVNDANRCYFCKEELFLRLGDFQKQHPEYKHALYGPVTDDLSDYRPGMKAAVLAGARAPLVEAKLSKAEVRILSLHFGLDSWDKPAAPCLSSRVAYGEYITKEKLTQIEQAEAFVRAEGFLEFRVRHHADIARLELQTSDIAKFFSDGRRTRIIENLKSLGYRYVTLDAQGFRSGSMNDVLESLPIIQG